MGLPNETGEKDQVQNILDRPDILLTVESYGVALRRSGREYTGRCPFHDDKTPSFSVNADKQVYFCHSCAEGGDVVRFVERIEGIGFKEALNRLGMGNGYVPRPRKSESIERASAKLANWLNEQHLKVGCLLRELSQKIAIAEQIPDHELLESLTREWEILSDLFEDLQSPSHAEELFRARDFIEAITQWAYPEPLPDFPTLTDERRSRLAAIVKGERC